MHVAAGKIVRQFSSLAGEANDWNEQADLVVAKLAKSLLGKHLDPNRSKEAVESALYQINAALAGAIRQETRDSSELSEINMSIPAVQDKTPQLFCRS